MKVYNSHYVFSPTDLSRHISCNHLTQLEKKALSGELKRPPVRENRIVDLLSQRGDSFEGEYLKQLKGDGKKVVEIKKDDTNATQTTIDAMAAGADVIYQGRLVEGDWAGWADYLIKKQDEKKSAFGGWHYEVLDTKLANETKAATIIQISLYTEFVTAIQGVQADYMYVKNPEGIKSYRVNDYMAFVRQAKTKFLHAFANNEPTYPDPAVYCDVCSWWEICNKKRRTDDHLSFIAGMGNRQIKEVRKKNIMTLAQMASPLPADFTPERGSLETYRKLNHQASLQLRSREEMRPVYEILPLIEGQGFYLLPEPTTWDVYLDLEGDPLVEGGGREYIIGWIFQGNYNILWAESAAKEKAAFEAFIDEIVLIKKAHPKMHIYHFGAYEETAFKRLMSRYGTREDEMDSFLRSGTFIDLHSVIKKSLRAGVERYSLKDLEKYHGYIREMDLRTLSGYKADYEFLLEMNSLGDATKEMKDAIQKYNEDDCRSTISLHKWLEKERKELVENGYNILRPEMRSGEASEKITEHQKRIKPLYDALMNGVPADKLERSLEQESKFVLANMLDWYRREEKSFWWEYFRLAEMDEDDLLDEKSAIALLQFTGEVADEKKSKIYTYRFPSQECDLRVGQRLVDRSNRGNGEIISLDLSKGIIKIKKGPSKVNDHTTPLFYLENYSQKDKEESLIQLAENVVEHGFNTSNPNLKSARDLLLRNNPELAQSIGARNTELETAIAKVAVLNNSTFPVQGPPGTGKSYCGSHMILELARQNKKVGITALSHKVIRNLLKAVQKRADDAGLRIKMIQKISKDDDGNAEWATTTDNGDVIAAFREYNVFAGTPFMWASSNFIDAVDYLFVDEAGQLSLIDTLSIARATSNLVLLGDPQQLKQPQKGSHPDGTEVSALEHVLNGQKTISAEQGMFLSRTFRLHPSICELDSELFYESRLNSVPGLERQRIEGNTQFAGSGFFYKPVMHEGNANNSSEEVQAVVHIVDELLKKEVYWINKDNQKNKLEKTHIKIISPYNAQVNDLKEILSDIEIGTVDKFQGQEAPVVIFSMATSAMEDAPRGMEFLYSPNRFNVAISRAKAVFILVANPKLFEVDCKSPEQIKLANAFCRFLEKAICI